jgi:hypothetical protein
MEKKQLDGRYFPSIVAAEIWLDGQISDFWGENGLERVRRTG